MTLACALAAALIVSLSFDMTLWQNFAVGLACGLLAVSPWTR